MDFTKYDKVIAQSNKNTLSNELIVEGANIIYFDNEKIKAIIHKIDHERKIVCFKNKNNFIWWDYFMDANWRVLEKIE